jgi:site-specific recombinase XerD
MEEYQAAISAAVPNATRQADEAKKGSFRHLCIQYYASASYKTLDGSTRSWQRRALDEIAKDHATKPVAMIKARHVRRMRDAKSATPAAANQLLKALRALFSWANEAEETTVNPMIGIKKLKYRSDGHHTWTNEEMQQFYKRHPLGSQARLALDLLRYTTGRREDAPRLGRQHLRDGRIRFRASKERTSQSD